ncbi:MAG: ribonuclease III [Clostridia bacterium]|nr:ribonuclease III [Clostridia bacterium]
MFPDEKLSLIKTNDLNGVTLAFMGDSVYELMARSLILSENSGKIGDLHKLTVAFSNASFQARAAKLVQPLLSEEETAVFKRGRNSHPGHTPKNKTAADYHLATALEALFGWLYIKNETERLSELFGIIAKEAEKLSDENKNEQKKI